MTLGYTAQYTSAQAYTIRFLTLLPHRIISCEFYSSGFSSSEGSLSGRRAHADVWQPPRPRDGLLIVRESSSVSFFVAGVFLTCSMNAGARAPGLHGDHTSLFSEVSSSLSDLRLTLGAG